MKIKIKNLYHSTLGLADGAGFRTDLASGAVVDAPASLIENRVIAAWVKAGILATEEAAAGDQTATEEAAEDQTGTDAPAGDQTATEEAAERTEDEERAELLAELLALGIKKQPHTGIAKLRKALEEAKAGG